MTIGKSPHVILGQEMLKPRDLSGFEMEGCPYNCVWCGIVSSGKKKGESRTFYVACNDTGNGRLPGVMGNDEPQVGH